VKASVCRIRASLTANIVDTAATVVVVWRLDVVTAHVGSLVADLHHTGRQLRISDWCIGIVVAGIASSCGAADFDLVKAAVVHVVGELGIVVDGVVVGFDTVGAREVSQDSSCKYGLFLLVDSKLWVVSCLDRLIDDTVDYAKSVEVERVALHAAVLNSQVLVVEVIEESWSVVTTI
jgi:hypothetical protein